MTRTDDDIYIIAVKCSVYEDTRHLRDAVSTTFTDDIQIIRPFDPDPVSPWAKHALISARICHGKGKQILHEQQTSRRQMGE